MIWVLLHRKLTSQHVLDERASSPRTWCGRTVRRGDTRIALPRDDFRTCRTCVWGYQAEHDRQAVAR